MPIKQRSRSPRYPSLSLAEAERMVKAIFEKDGMNPVDRESAVHHIGYTSLNGASATALASLKQYGLTMDAGKGMMQVAPLALDLIEPESDEGRAEALLTAAFTPDLFSSLREKFPDSVPSEGNLRAYLLRQEFTTAAVKTVVPAYLDTCEYVANAVETESNGITSDLEPESPSPDKLESNVDQVPASGAAPVQTKSAAALGSKRMIFDAMEGEVEFTYPDNLSEDSIEDLEEWFALVTKRLRRAAKH